MLFAYLMRNAPAGARASSSADAFRCRLLRFFFMALAAGVALSRRAPEGRRHSLESARSCGTHARAEKIYRPARRHTRP